MRTLTAVILGASLMVAGCGVSEVADDPGEDGRILQAVPDRSTTADSSASPSSSVTPTSPSPTSVFTTAVPTSTSTSTTTVPASTSKSTTSTTSTSTTIAPQVIAAVGHLADLVIAEPDPDRGPYVRDAYDGDGWDDIDGDCLSTRHELLAAHSLVDPTLSSSGCRVDEGRWIDPYDGAVYESELDVSIDHLVPLAEAHRAGAWKWDDETKHRFANDETAGHLIVVGRDSNQAKGDKRPDEWMPPSNEAHCQYAIDWITTKARYGLTIVAAERDALTVALGTCRTAPTIRPAGDASTPVVVVTAPTTTTTSTIAPSVGPGIITLIGCDRWSETVTIANTGGESISLSGFLLHDEGAKHSTSLDGFGSLAPGEQLRILTGGEATSGQGQVVWKRQNVWNNDGDAAHLVGFGAEQTANC